MSSIVSSVSDIGGCPSIVQISDIHGYLADARSALLAVGETEDYDPIVTADDAGTLHWAENDFVLVINGDVLDRGPENEAALEMLWRLIEQAPPGRVRYNIGNHEMPIFVPDVLNWPGTFSSKMVETSRESFLQRVLDGDVTASFEGYKYIYSHAGSNELFDPETINSRLREATEQLLDNIGTTDDSSPPQRLVEQFDQTVGTSLQQQIVEQYDRIFELGEAGGRGPSAGICWMDFSHMAESSPPQIVGHSMQNTPTRKGNVICGNVIRRNQMSKGGEGVLIETPDEVQFVHRTPDGSASVSSV